MNKNVLGVAGVALIAIVIGGAVFLFGGSDFTTSQKGGDKGLAAVNIPFTKLMQGARSGVPTRVNYLLTSQAQLGEMWKMINATGTPPTVNFKTHTVLAVFAGDTPGTEITISKIEDIHSGTNARVVSVLVTKPNDTCINKVSIKASPYEIVKVASTSLPITHKDVLVAARCTK